MILNTADPRRTEDDPAPILIGGSALPSAQARKCPSESPASRLGRTPSRTTAVTRMIVVQKYMHLHVNVMLCPSILLTGKNTYVYNLMSGKNRL
jgi:hypothetical protein